MRWMAIVGIALCAAVGGAAALRLAMAPNAVKPFVTRSELEPDSFGSTSTATADDDIGSPSELGPFKVVAPASDEATSTSADEEERQVLLGGMRDLRGSSSASAKERLTESDHAPAMPQIGPEVEQFAEQMAPALAREALAPQKSPMMPEVEHELLETWKEQQQILAGKRETIDSVLRPAE